MIEEPDIVKQLREEEKAGKLQYKNFDLKFKIFERIGFKTKELHDNKSEVKISSYKDAFDLAKKVLNELNDEF
jgi:hypothetical protein